MPSNNSSNILSRFSRDVFASKSNRLKLVSNLEINFLYQRHTLSERDMTLSCNVGAKRKLAHALRILLLSTINAPFAPTTESVSIQD